MFRYVNKYVIGIITFYIIWLGLLPLVLTKTVTVLCNNLSRNSGYEIRIEKPEIKLYFTPVVKFKADIFSIKDKDSSDVFNADDLSVRIRLFPLLAGKCRINSFKTANLFIKKEIKKDTVLNKNFFKKLDKTKFIFNFVEVSNFNILFQTETNNPTSFSGKEFLFNKQNRSVRLNFDSMLTSEKKSSKIFINLFLPKNSGIERTRFDIEISNLDIEPIGKFFKNFLPSHIENFKGDVNLSASKYALITTFNNVKVLYGNNIPSIIFPEKLTIKSKFNINRDEINLKSVDLNSDNINIQLSGSVRDYIGKNMPITDLRVVINSSGLENFIDIMPPFKIDEFDGTKLKKYKFFGDVIGNLSISGRLPEPNVTGNIYIDNGILIKPIPNETKGAIIKLMFTGNQVNYDVRVPAGLHKRVLVNGTQELYNIKYSDLTIKSTKNIDVKTAKDIVNPLHEIFNFLVGPLPILDITGDGDIDLAIHGTRAYPHATGTLNFYNTAVNFTNMPDLVLKDAEATLIFNDTNVVFKSDKAKLNGKDFSISGISNFNGSFDFDTLSEDQPTTELYKAMKTSTMLGDMTKILPDAEKFSGFTDLKLKIYGTVKKIEDLQFNKNAFAKGTINIKQNDIAVFGVNINNADAEIKIDGTSILADLKGYVSGSLLNIKAKVKNNIANLYFNIPKFNLNSVLSDNYAKSRNYLPFISLNGTYKGNVENFEYNKLNFTSNIIPQLNSEPIIYNFGKIDLNNGKLIIKNLDFNIKNQNNNIKADMQIENLFSKTPAQNGLIKLKFADITAVNEILGSGILPQNLNNIVKNYEFRNGTLNLNAKFVNSKLSTEGNLAGIEFNYIPLEMPVGILNGKFIIRNNNLRLQAINILADGMPLLLDGEIKDITEKQDFNLYINSKPHQEFIDKFVNKYTIYPLKIKGDIVYNMLLKGNPDNFNIETNINIAKDSFVYYYGATVGDIENAIVVSLNSVVQNKNDVRIKEFLYDKIIDSQNGKQTRLNMLKVRGGLTFLPDDIEFKDLFIKTSNPTDARIFNIIFGKPNIKQGQFTSDLKMKGKLSNPKITGDFHIVETNIPFLDTTMKNIEFLFKEKTLDIYSKGEVMGSDVIVEAVLKNKLTKPYHIEQALVSTKDMNLNRIVDKLKTNVAENEQPQDSFGNFDINSIVADKLKLHANNVILRNIHATNFEAETSLNEKRIFEIKNFMFNIAQGNLKGKYSYNLNSNDIKLDLNANKISANDITWAVFDLQNQIYGDLTGSLQLSCNGETFEKCMQTLNGNTSFNVKNGRMPKLGSLEYLLKAGNLLKGGITSLSINGVIDLISPMKTGEFSDIFGIINIKDGIADNIEITTQGNDLSLFIGGTYNFATSIADMEILGMLSRKISTMFGTIGNISVNTLFNLIPGIDLSKNSDVLANINKIPGIEISNKSFRKFIAEVKGNINGDNYVTSFRWIN